jgi:TP901 family phage tail tape measure protein
MRRKAIIDIEVNGEKAIAKLERLAAKRATMLQNEITLVNRELAVAQANGAKQGELLAKREVLEEALAKSRLKRYTKYFALQNAIAAKEAAVTRSEEREGARRDRLRARRMRKRRRLRIARNTDEYNDYVASRELGRKGDRAKAKDRAIAAKAEAAAEHKARMTVLAVEKGAHIKSEVELKRHLAAKAAATHAALAAIMPRSMGGPGRQRKASGTKTFKKGGLGGGAPSPRAGLGPGGGFGYMGVGGGLAVAGIAGFAGAGLAKSAASSFLEQEVAVTRMMSLVTREEQKMGFTLERGRKAAQDLARTLGVDVAEAAMIMRRAITAAVDPSDAQAAAQVGHGLAVIEGADPEKVTQMLATVRNAFGASAGSFKEIANIIFTGVDEGLVKLEETSGILGNLAASTATVGFSFKETMAAHTALTRGGMSGPRAGTALRSFAEILMKDPTEKVRAARGATGLTGVLESGDMDLMSTLEAFKNAADSSDYSMTELLGGRQRALRALLPLTGELRDDMYDILDAMDRNVESDRRMLETQKMMNTEAMQFKRLTSAIDVGWGQIGDGISTAFLDWIKDGREIDDVIKDWGVSFEKAAGKVGTLSTLMGRAMNTTGAIMEWTSVFSLFNKVMSLTAPARDNAKVAARDARNSAIDKSTFETFVEHTAAEKEKAEAAIKISDDAAERIAKMKENREAQLRSNTAAGLKESFDIEFKDTREGYNKRLAFIREHYAEAARVVNKHFSALKKSRADFESWGQSLTAKKEAFRKKVRPETGNESISRGLKRFGVLKDTANAQQGFGRTADSLKTRGQAMDASAGFADMDLQSFMTANIDDQTIEQLVGNNAEFGAAPWKKFMAIRKKREEVAEQQRKMRNSFQDFNMAGGEATAGMNFSQWFAKQGMDEQGALGNTQGFAATMDGTEEKLTEAISQHDRLKALSEGIRDAWRGTDESVANLNANMATLMERARGMTDEAFVKEAAKLGAQGKGITDTITAFGSEASERFTGGSPEQVDSIAGARKIVYNTINVTVPPGTDARGVANTVADRLKTEEDRGVANANPNK